jgi:hypothetical protein
VEGVMIRSRPSCLDSLQEERVSGLSEASFRLIYELGCISERSCRPAMPRAGEADRAHDLAELGLLCEHHGFDAGHQYCLSYTVTSAGSDVFNRVACRRDASRLSDAA